MIIIHTNSLMHLIQTLSRLNKYLRKHNEHAPGSLHPLLALELVHLDKELVRRVVQCALEAILLRHHRGSHLSCSQYITQVAVFGSFL